MRSRWGSMIETLLNTNKIFSTSFIGINWGFEGLLLHLCSVTAFFIWSSPEHRQGNPFLLQGYELKGKAEPGASTVAVARVVAAKSSTAKYSDVVTATAAMHAVGARHRTCGIGLGITGVRAVQVLTPLPYVAAHVVNT